MSIARKKSENPQGCHQRLSTLTWASGKDRYSEFNDVNELTGRPLALEKDELFVFFQRPILGLQLTLLSLKHFDAVIRHAEKPHIL